MNQPSNEAKPQNNKLNKKLLVIVIMVDTDQFTQKNKLVTNTGAFVQPYNWKNHK